MVDPKPKRVLSQREKELVIQSFALHAQPVISRAFGIGCCIQACRLTLGVLEAFDIPAQARPAKLFVGYPERNLSYNLGSRPEELIAKGQQLLPQNFDERGWMGHLVVVPDHRMQDQRWLLDPSFEQVIQALDNAGAQITWRPVVELIPLSERFDRKHPQRHVIDLPNGKPLLVEYTATQDSSYRRDKKWKREPLEPMIKTMSAAIGQDLGLYSAGR